MFQNREEAGILLSKKLKEYKDSKEVLVLAIPRGGVVVGKQIADNLHLPLSLIVVKKLGAPYNPELAIGAVAADGVKVVDREIIARLGIEQEYLDEEIERKRKEIEEKIKLFRIKNQESRLCQGFDGQARIKNYKIIILVDDGVATGATTLVAIKYIKESQKSKIILAVPVIARDSYDRLKSEVDKIIALEIPEYFGAVGQFYREFGQVSDEEVIEYLRTIEDRK